MLQQIPWKRKSCPVPMSGAALCIEGRCVALAQRKRANPGQPFASRALAWRPARAIVRRVSRSFGQGSLSVGLYQVLEVVNARA